MPYCRLRNGPSQHGPWRRRAFAVNLRSFLLQDQSCYQMGPSRMCCWLRCSSKGSNNRSKSSNDSRSNNWNKYCLGR